MFSTRRILLLLIVLVIAAPLAFFARFEAFSEHLEDELHFENATANSAKHAYAAGSIYSVLRSAYAGPETAENIVLLLGIFNEYAETIFKISEPDSTLEIMKDMYNNQAGIMAAEWAHGEGKPALRDVIIHLAKTEGIALSAYSVPMAPAEKIEDFPQSVRDALDWFMSKRENIRTNTAEVLARY